jgi:hypothetical protein
MAKTTNVSRQAIMARLNRHLAHQGQALRQCAEGRRFHDSLGAVYVIDTARNLVITTHIDLEDFARSLGVLKRGERVDE